jgi:hypothetical protein
MSFSMEKPIDKPLNESLVEPLEQTIDDPQYYPLVEQLD